VVEGIPILVAPGRSVFSADDVVQRRQVEIRPSVARALVRRAIPSRTLAIGTAERYAHFARRLGEATADRQAKVLVIGGGQLGQGAASLFQSGLDVIESDVYLGPRVDVVCDGHNLPFPDETFDGVVLQAVLEHVLDPAQVVAEAYRVLRPHGLVYAETPFLQAVHEGAFDFTRWTDLGHRRLFRMFTELDRGVVVGPATTLLWAIIYFARSIPPRGSGALIVEKLVTLVFFWLKYFDRILLTHPGAVDGASGVYFVGQKSTTPLDDRELLKTYRGLIGRPMRRGR